MSSLFNAPLYPRYLDTMTTKTYGQKPKSFQLDDGERYYIGAEIGQYLKYGRGHLYKRFPQLYKRPANQSEKKQIQELGVSNAYTHSTVMLLKEHEVDELLEGQEEKFRATAPSGSASRNDSQRLNANKQIGNWYVVFEWWVQNLDEYSRAQILAAAIHPFKYLL